MSNTAKFVVVVVAVVVIGGIWWWSAGQGGTPASPVANAPAAVQPPTGQGTPGASTLTGGNSNANLNQDLAQIDGQMSGFAADSASINQGLSDQPVSQQAL